MVANVLKCRSCCRKYILTADQKDTKYCRICRKVWFEAKKREKEQAQQLEWEKQRRKNQELYEKELTNYHLIVLDEIIPSNPLYIIGNGFDLMHRVQSSYYCFRDSLARNNGLRWTLETALTPDDIWADFENALGHLNLDLMGSRSIVDMWLDDFGVYDDDDSGAAEYYMAVEAAANPIITITNELQPAFRRWIEKLSLGTDDRPLSKVLKPDGKVLCFNYTEFIEKAYGLKDICYIHGCRKNKKETLVLGHRPGMFSELSEKWKRPKNYRQALIDITQQNVLQLIGEYDEDLTKDSQLIIQNNRDFFDGLDRIDQVIVIGHSVSLVDWDYFKEVAKVVSGAKWYFGCHGLNDLIVNA